MRRAPPAVFAPTPVSVLYVPGHNLRALDKARGLAADMIVIDLEDAVPANAKAAAREGAAAALLRGYGPRPVALRINGADSDEWGADLALAARVAPDALVVPKADDAGTIDAVAAHSALPLIAMIETPAGVLHAPAIAAHDAVIGLIAGLNDLAHALHLPDGRDRSAMGHAIQAIVLAARAGGVMAYDGVYNAIDDAAGFITECADGHRLGFDGKTLIHPGQIEACNAAFAPSPAAIAEANALIAAGGGASTGAVRHDGRMVEAMHVRAAERLLAREALRSARRGGIAPR